MFVTDSLPDLVPEEMTKSKATLETGGSSENGSPKEESSFKYIDHVYCINLPQSKLRRKEMEEQFLKLDWSSCFVRATHPEHTGFSELIRNESKVNLGNHYRRCYCTHKCKHPTRRLRYTEVAISLSHLNCYKRLVKNRDRWAMICEDDIVFIPTMKEVIETAIPEEVWITDKPVIIFLGSRDNPGLAIRQVNRFQLYHSKIGLYSNYCYLVNAPAAAVLIKNFHPIRRPEDSFKRHLINQGKISCWVIKPGLVSELSYGVNTKAKFRRLSLMDKIPVDHETRGRRRFQSQFRKKQEQSGPSDQLAIGKTNRVLRVFGKDRKTKMKIAHQSKSTS